MKWQREAWLLNGERPLYFRSDIESKSRFSRFCELQTAAQMRGDHLQITREGPQATISKRCGIGSRPKTVETDIGCPGKNSRATSRAVSTEETLELHDRNLRRDLTGYCRCGGIHVTSNTGF